MKKYKLITCMLLFAGYLSAQNNLSALLPMPNQVKQIDSKKDFIISDKTTIQTNLPDMFDPFSKTDLSCMSMELAIQSSIKGWYIS